MLKSISPVDGRYEKKVKFLSSYFSEYAIIRYRIKVEIEYFIALSELSLPALKGSEPKHYEKLRNIYLGFSLKDAEKVKEIEKVINHDVKAVEYFIKEKFDDLELQEYKEFIHFGLTSQDINNTAFPMAVRDAIDQEYVPLLNKLSGKLVKLSSQWKDIPMLALTHGQPASPTRLGKEIKVFAYRIDQQKKLLNQVVHSAKFSGATGNFNAHYVAFPSVDWKDFSNKFLKEKLGLEREKFTTQISNYDNFGALCDNLKRINTILIDLNRDLWTYISRNYFLQKIKKGEVGSSAMPHKINPIDFENSEGNLGFANSIFEHLSAKLPISRLQRDLTDSTVIRNIGVPFAHTMIGFFSLLQGLNKIELNRQKIEEDLDNNWVVVAEAIQTILRREKYSNPYEALKVLTRNNAVITKENIWKIIDSLEVSNKVKMEMKKISPFNYTGI